MQQASRVSAIAAAWPSDLCGPERRLHSHPQAIMLYIHTVLNCRQNRQEYAFDVIERRRPGIVRPTFKAQVRRTGSDHQWRQIHGDQRRSGRHEILPLEEIRNSAGRIQTRGLMGL